MIYNSVIGDRYVKLGGIYLKQETFFSCCQSYNISLERERLTSISVSQKSECYQNHLEQKFSGIFFFFYSINLNLRGRTGSITDIDTESGIGKQSSNSSVFCCICTDILSMNPFLFLKSAMG